LPSNQKKKSLANQRATDIKVGLTVLIGIVALLVGIGLAKRISFRAPQNVARAKFITTGGLEVADPVDIGGVRQGSVSDIETHPGYEIVTMQFDSPVELHKDAHATIMMLELMGGKKIELQTGVSNERLPDSALINGTFGGDVGTLVSMITSLSGTLQSLTVHADSVLLFLNDFFRNNDLKTKVNVTLTDAQSTLTHFDETALRVNKLLDQTSEPLKTTLSQAETATADLAAMLKEDRPGLRALLDTTTGIAGDARGLMKRATSIFAQIDTLLSQASQSNTLLYKLTKDKEFGNRLDKLVRSLILFIEQTRKGGIDANIRFFHGNTPDTVNLQ
jgi:phospholipid/cholesterol/gamma-HCH transport system substrate-binding protein